MSICLTIEEVRYLVPRNLSLLIIVFTKRRRSVWLWQGSFIQVR